MTLICYLHNKLIWSDEVKGQIVLFCNNIEVILQYLNLMEIGQDILKTLKSHKNVLAHTTAAIKINISNTHTPQAKRFKMKITILGI